MKEATEINIGKELFWFILLLILLLMVSYAPDIENPPIRVQGRHYSAGEQACSPHVIESISWHDDSLYLYCAGGVAMPLVWDEEGGDWLPPGRSP